MQLWTPCEDATFNCSKALQFLGLGKIHISGCKDT